MNMNWVTKIDKWWIGILTGIVFPFLVFFLYWLIFYNYMSFPRGFVRYWMGGNTLSNVIKICGLGNLLIFYFGLNYKIDRFSKGIILSVVLYVILVFYVTYNYEPVLL